MRLPWRPRRFRDQTLDGEREHVYSVMNPTPYLPNHATIRPSISASLQSLNDAFVVNVFSRFSLI